MLVSRMYGIYYLMFATFPREYHSTINIYITNSSILAELFSEVYGFSTGTGGLAYLGLGIGFMLATVFGASISDKIYAHLVAKNNGVGKPEMRIPSLIFGSLFVPVGLL